MMKKRNYFFRDLIRLIIFVVLIFLFLYIYQTFSASHPQFIITEQTCGYVKNEWVTPTVPCYDSHNNTIQNLSCEGTPYLNETILQEVHFVYVDNISDYNNSINFSLAGFEKFCSQQEVSNNTELCSDTTKVFQNQTYFTPCTYDYELTIDWLNQNANCIDQNYPNYLTEFKNNTCKGISDLDCRILFNYNYPHCSQWQLGDYTIKVIQ